VREREYEKITALTKTFSPKLLYCARRRKNRKCDIKICKVGKRENFFNLLSNIQ